MQHIDIVKASENDVDIIYDIMMTAYEELPDKDMFFVDDKEFIKEHINEKGFCLLAKIDDEYVGYMWVCLPYVENNHLGRYLGFSDEELMDTAILDSVAVKKKYRGRRIMKSLIEEVSERIRSLGINNMIAKAHPANKASIKSFVDRGFEIMTKIREHGTERYILYKNSQGKEKNEFFTLFNENGEPTGIIKERKAVHRDGDLHGAVHIWIIDKKQEKLMVLLQKRSANKDSFPNCYDCSSAGHVSAGETFESAAIRELYEELSIEADREDFTFLFKQVVGGEYTFADKPFKNHEVNFVYLYDKPVDIEKLHFQEEEISGLYWQDANEVLKLLKKGSNGKNEAPESGYCMWIDEFERVLSFMDARIG